MQSFNFRARDSFRNTYTRSILPLGHAGCGGGQCLAFLSRLRRRLPGQAGSSAPQPRCPPTTLGWSGGKCNGAAGSADLPGGLVAPGRYAGLGTLATGGGAGCPGRRLWCLWADWAKIQILGASLGLGSSSLDTGPGWPWLLCGGSGRAGLGLWPLDLSWAQSPWRARSGAGG